VHEHEQKFDVALMIHWSQSKLSRRFPPVWYLPMVHPKVKSYSIASRVKTRGHLVQYVVSRLIDLDQVVLSYPKQQRM
jgi:hypothetical protein